MSLPCSIRFPSLVVLSKLCSAECLKAFCGSWLRRRYLSTFLPKSKHYGNPRGCAALLIDLWEWLQHWGLKRVPWVGVEGSAPAQVDIQAVVPGLHEALEGSAWQKNNSGLLLEKEEQILNNYPKQVHGCAKHTEERWWLIISNIKSMWCPGFCGISVGSGMIQIVPVILPGRRDCGSQSTQPSNWVQNWSHPT